MGGEGVMMWVLFFLPAAVCFAICAIYRYRLIRSIRKLQDAAFYNCFDED